MRERPARRRLTGAVVASALLTAAFWSLGAATPAHPRAWSSLDLRWHYYYLYEAFYRVSPAMLWNPWQLCGIPWIGTLQGGFFYPPHVLYLLLPTHSALAVSTVLHLALAAGAMAALVRGAGLSAPAAVLAAMLFALAGPLRDWQLWPALLEAAAWMPVGGIGVLHITRGSTARGGILVGIGSGASFLAGFPQGTVLSVYAWAALLLAFDLQNSRPWRAVASHGLVLGTGIAAGACIGAVALLPGWELTRESVRHASTLPVRLMYPISIPPARRTLESWWVSGRPLFLMAAALLPMAFGPTRRRLASTLATVALATGTLALGPGTPLFAAYSVLPALGWFRVPHRLFIVTQFCLAILAAVGLEAFARRARGTVAALALAVGVSIALVSGLAAERPTPRLPYEAASVPWDSAMVDAYRRLARLAGRDRVWPFSPGFTTPSLPPKLPTLTSLRSIEDYEPLTLSRQAEYFVYFLEGSTVAADPRAPFNGRMRSLTAPVGRDPPASRRRLLDHAAVRFMTFPVPVWERADVRAFLQDAGWGTPWVLGPGLLAVENPHALPRAFVTYQAERAPPADELLGRLADPTFDPLRTSYVDGGTVPLPRSDRTGHAAEIVVDTPHAVEVHAHLAAPGLVVLADTFARGWTATVDGAPAPILATNHLFRGVPAPAGTHRVRFAYRPRMLFAGAATSLLAALGLVLAAYRLRPRRA